ncbi:MAG: hypothetical protein AAF203_10970 [Pseudomonadota bacterium]
MNNVSSFFYKKGTLEFLGDDIEIIDILAPHSHPEKESFLDQLPSLLEECREDRLFENYCNLGSELENYECFTVCKRDGQILGFSGLMSSHFKHHGRALTRTFYSRGYRRQSLGPHNLPNLATAIMLPYQVQFAIDRDFKGVFVSMQDRRRRSYFKNIFEKINRVWTQGTWIVPEMVFNTCRLMGSDELVNEQEACWQSIAYLEFENMGKPQLPEKDIR